MHIVQWELGFTSFHSNFQPRYLWQLFNKNICLVLWFLYYWLINTIICWYSQYNLKNWIGLELHLNMVGNDNGAWLTLIKAGITGQRLNSKIVKLYIFSSLLTLLTVFLGLIEMLHLIKQPTKEDGDFEASKMFANTSRFTRNHCSITKKNPCRLHAS